MNCAKTLASELASKCGLVFCGHDSETPSLSQRAAPEAAVEHHHNTSAIGIIFQLAGTVQI